MADGRIYMLQPSFASGEISPDVASRVDLDKYQSALLQAENVFIRPYGSAYRRPGTLFRSNTGSGAKVLLQQFTVDASTSYLLAISSTLVRIYREEIVDGEETLALIDSSISSPWSESELPKLRFAQSADVMFIASGTKPVKVLKRTGVDTFSFSNFVAKPGYFDVTTATEGVTIVPSDTVGTVTLTASGNVFSNGMIGNHVQLTQSAAAITRTRSIVGEGTELLCGPAGWKVISHGTWKGEFSIDYSYDTVTWYTLRTYTSNNDFNVTESGTFDDLTYIRINIASIDSGSLTVDLTRLPFNHSGWARITGYTDEKHVTAIVGKRFLNDTDATSNWAFGSWDDNYGYPSCVTFFQDRLCFAANKRQPYMVWMSRTGDYYNFGTEKVEGTLTDDSAVAISFISRQDYNILHLMAHSDLMVMTEGNEWIISGSEVVTPANVTPRVQSSRGTTDVVPVMIGGQIIYVQRHGRTVRDMQYNFSTDSYDGMDLTILAKHITQDTTIVDVAYRQEPDYMCFFVLADGTVACLTYINEQRVYAWSRFETKDGNILSVETLNGEDHDSIYFAVKRGSKVVIEKLAEYQHTNNPDDYVMLDCAETGTNVVPTTGISAATQKNLGYDKVDILADGRHFRDITIDDYDIARLPVEVTNYIVGIPYTSTWELPNIEMQLQDGTLQGRRKKVAEVILRLERSLGGRVGINTNKTDVIKYDELMNQDVTLYSGEKLVTVPNVTAGGFNDKGRVVVTSDDPYPLSISSIVRAVVPGG